LRKLHRALDDQEQEGDVVGEMLSRKVPIHFGGISDPFCSPSVAAVSRELLLHLSSYGYPVLISTKNTDLLLEDETMKIIAGMKNIAVQVSFTSLDAERTRLIEPNAPAAKARLQCLDTLSKEGIHVIARLQHLFPSFESYVAENLIPSLGSLGCKHVAVEYLKLPVEKNISLIKRIFSILGWDGFDFYHHNHALLVGREWVLPSEFKWERLQPLIKSIRECGMTYGSADYGLNHMGDTDCCCGIDDVAGFGNWFRGNFSNIIRHSPSNELTSCHLNDYWLPRGSVKMYMNSNCRLNGNNQIMSYLLQKWNSPGTANAPDSFFGVSWDGYRDAIGNCIYTIREDLCKSTRLR